MATIPATTPGPMIDTSKSDQIKELIEREETMIRRAIGLTNLVLGVVCSVLQEKLPELPLLLPSLSRWWQC